MDATEAIRARRSIRRYVEGAEVSQENINVILEAAMLAPSAANKRPWDFVVVKSQEAREAIAEACPYAGMVPKAPIAIVVCARPDLQKGGAAGFYPSDCGAVCENILLQAVDLGLGACWCGVWPDPIRIKGVHGVVGGEGVPYAVIAIGVPDENPAARGFFDESRVRYL